MNKFQTFTQFLKFIENNFDEEEQIIIEDFMSYYINEYRGFGKYNCKYTYEDNLKYDTTGKLHNIALIGFEFEKKNHDEHEAKKSKKKT